MKLTKTEIKSKIIDIGIKHQINYDKFIEILEETVNDCKIIKIIKDDIGGIKK